MLPLDEHRTGTLHDSAHDLGAAGQGPAVDLVGPLSDNGAIPGMTLGAKVYSAFAILVAGFLLFLLASIHFFGSTKTGAEYFIVAVIWIMFVSLSVTTALNLYYRQLLTIPTIVQIATLCLLVLGLLLPLLGSWVGYGYDKERYTQIRRAIDADQDHLLGKSLEEITRELSLEGVPFDKFPAPQGMSVDEEIRIYHFPGFACYVTVGTLSPDVTPDGMHLASSSQPAAARQGKLPLTVKPPGVVIDGFSNPKARMEQYWKRERDTYEQMRRTALREDNKANTP